MRIISFETAEEIYKYGQSAKLDITSNKENMFYTQTGGLVMSDPFNIRYKDHKVLINKNVAYPACRLDELFEYLLNRNIFVSIRMNESGFYYYRIHANKIQLVYNSDSLNENYYNCLEEGLREALKYL